MTKPILYSADWCPYCRTVKKWLDKNQVSYELRDVDEAVIRQEMNDKADGNQTIPTLVIGEEYYVNPSVPTLQELFQK